MSRLDICDCLVNNHSNISLFSIWTISWERHQNLVMFHAILVSFAEMTKVQIYLILHSEEQASHVLICLQRFKLGVSFTCLASHVARWCLTAKFVLIFLTGVIWRYDCLWQWKGKVHIMIPCLVECWNRVFFLCTDFTIGVSCFNDSNTLSVLLLFSFRWTLLIQRVIWIVQCEGGEWFHYQCVGLSSETRFKGKWYCPHCRSLQRRGMLDVPT